MKLYFYFLDTRKENCIRMEECEVEEKALMYKPLERLPKYYSGNCVMKWDIEKLTGTSRDTVILTENNPLIAADIFSKKCRDDIDHIKMIIWAKEQQMEEINRIRLRIEKWGVRECRRIKRLRKGISAKLYR